MVAGHRLKTVALCDWSVCQPPTPFLFARHLTPGPMLLLLLHRIAFASRPPPLALVSQRMSLTAADAFAIKVQALVDSTSAQLRQRELELHAEWQAFVQRRMMVQELNKEQGAGHSLASEARKVAPPPLPLPSAVSVWLFRQLRIPCFAAPPPPPPRPGCARHVPRAHTCCLNNRLPTRRVRWGCGQEDGP